MLEIPSKHGIFCYYAERVGYCRFPTGASAGCRRARDGQSNDKRNEYPMTLSAKGIAATEKSVAAIPLAKLDKNAIAYFFAF